MIRKNSGGPRRAAWLTAATLALAVAGASTASAETLRYLTSWHVGNPKTTNDAVTDYLLAAVPKATGGKVELKRFGPEVVPPFQQVEPVSSGVFDMLYTNAAYHAGATTIGQIIDTVVPDATKRRSSGVWAWVDGYYQKKLNLKVLAIIPSTGYHFVLKQPIGNDGGLEGRKIRSNPAYDQIIRQLGGSPVQLPVPQVYTALEKGLVDGTAWPMHTMMAQRLYEVAKYIARPEFATSTQIVLMNLSKWQSEPPAIQTALLDVGKKVEAVGLEDAERIAKEEQAGMLAHGAKFTEIGPKYAKRINTLFDQGIWERATAKSGDDARQLIALIKTKGMVNQ